ncbi:lactoylglutathione lyase-like lyase [Halosimplex carlsbadense 2-9-1]|uniref:Lactoylglutathione lyase-like lyase n=1 Tax=Halosimplex carlsbadense 2-9-1 TaxID=797114 RepID=M0D3U4_9EURY|nr:VOC family protein [Halosimplex carlsbadense]ELZ28834.1 lactoylglutathione lyase-like lyase [Halosimplex carlsbadense 2-9-1]
MSGSVHHTGTTVADLDRAVEFYTEVFDLEILAEFESSGENFSRGVGVDEATGRFAHLDGDGTRVELVEYEPEGDDAAAESVNDRGAKHLGFGVDDVEAFYEALPDDVETVSEPQTSSTGTTILFLRDPEGNLIEVLDA